MFLPEQALFQGQAVCAGVRPGQSDRGMRFGSASVLFCHDNHDLVYGSLPHRDRTSDGALQQGKAITVMRVKCGAIQLRQFTDFLYRDPVDRLLAEQRQKGFLQYALRVADPCISFFHAFHPFHRSRRCEKARLSNTIPIGVGYLSHAG